MESLLMIALNPTRALFVNAHNLYKIESLRSIQRKYTTGRPDQKDLSENLAATQGLAHMINECQCLFQVRTRDLQQRLIASTLFFM